MRFRRRSGHREFAAFAVQSQLAHVRGDGADGAFVEERECIALTSHVAR